MRAAAPTPLALQRSRRGATIFLELRCCRTFKNMHRIGLRDSQSIMGEEARSPKISEQRALMRHVTAGPGSHGPRPPIPTYSYVSLRGLFRCKATTNFHPYPRHCHPAGRQRRWSAPGHSSEIRGMPRANHATSVACCGTPRLVRDPRVGKVAAVADRQQCGRHPRRKAPSSRPFQAHP